MSFKRKALCAAIFAAFQVASYGQGVNANITTTGAANPLSFTATIYIPQSYVGNNSKLWMAILQGDQAYFFNGTTGFVPYTGGLAALLSNSRTEAPSVRSITNTTETISLTGDASGVMGGQVYIGYGATFGELINNARYKNVYNVTVPAAITAGNYSSSVVNQIMQVPIVFPVETPGGWPLSPTGHYGRYMNFGTNGGAHGDLRGTGLDDIVISPNSMPNFLPYSKMEFWVNNGDGTFTNKAEQLIVGGAPVWAMGPTIIADFNGDGIKDIMHLDSPENGQCTGENNLTICKTGGKFTYLKGLPNGTWVDQSSFPPKMPIDSVMYAGSSNGDGVKDLLFSANGLHFYKNDGNGNFTDQTYRLPLEIRGFADGTAQWQATGGLFQSGLGGAAFVKVAGQAKPVLVNASYGRDLMGQAPQSTDTTSIRFFTQNADGTFTKAQTIIMPRAVSDNNCGAREVNVGDFTRTGTDDVLVAWEGPLANTNLNLTCHPMLYRNIGTNGQINYVDVTETSMPQWRSVFAFTMPYGLASANGFDFADVDGNGTLDIAMTGPRWGSNVMVQATPFLYNDGNGNFSVRPFKMNGVTPTSEAAAALMGENVQLSWANTVVALRLKPNQPYGMLFIESGHFENGVSTDQTTTPYIVDKQIRLHAFLPQ